VVEYLNIFFCKFTTDSVSEKKFENRLIFGEVMGKRLVSCFLTHSVLHHFLLYVLYCSMSVVKIVSVVCKHS